MKKTLKRTFLLISLIVVVAGLYYGTQAGKIATAYVAKTACSCTMVSNRPIEAVMKEDLVNYAFIDVQVNKKEKSVTASVIGLIKKKAIYRKGLGCTLVNGFSEEELRSQVKEKQILPPQFDSQARWPVGDVVGSNLPEEIDSVQLFNAVNRAFEESDSNKLKRTRAVIVIYKGEIIAEKYGKGISQNTPLLGWSMTKSVINALTGILVKEGKIKINDKTEIEEWQNDERKNITLDQLLRMSSGLKFDETYNVVADATKMLFLNPVAAEAAINKQLKESPDSIWSYSSGTSNIISLILKNRLNATQIDYFNFPRKSLFNKISMSSAVIEPDPSGTFVGSSFMYATARDWARFGLLYLYDGVWNNERILPEGWVKYSATPTSKAPQGQYGAHFWLNAGENKNGKNRKWMNLPSDMYFASGFEGQNIMILPSNDLIVVRLGNTQDRKGWDITELVAGVLSSFKNNN